MSIPVDSTTTVRSSAAVLRPSSGALLLIVALTFALGVLAWRVSVAETVAVGTDADRIYITDGFYDPEHSTENGIYRWMQPLGQLGLPDWGPGRIHISVSGKGVVTSQVTLKISGVPVAQADVHAGQPWRVQAWGVSASRDPTVTIEAPPFSAPGDKRALGLLVQSVEIYAPDARVRALLNIALLGLAGALLFLFLQLRTSLFAMATIAGLSVPALLAPFAAYRDPWMDTVAWVAPLALALLLVLGLRRSGVRGRERGVRGEGSGVRGQGPADVNNPRSAIRNPQLKRSAFIILALTFALLLLYLGYMNAFDSDRMYQVTAGIAEYGRPTRYPGFSTWTKYGFGQPLIAVPFYLLGKVGALLGGLRSASLDPVARLAVSLTNLPVAAITCWLLYRAGRRFAPATVALAVAATYLLATPALNYARTFFSEPAGGLLLLAALLLIIPRSSTEPLRPRRALLAGACLGAMILFKPAFVVYLPAPGLAVLWLAFRRQGPGVRDQGSEVRDQGPVGEGRGSMSLQSIAGRLSVVGLFAIGPIVGLLVQAGYDYLRYAPLPNAIFRTGYEKEPGFSTPLLEGLGGILFSPGKSIFLYAPVLFLAPVGLWLMFRRGDASGKLTVALVLAEVAAGLVFNSLWWAWTGNFAWGPRLIMPILPLLIWPLAAVGGWAVGGRQLEDGSPPQPPQPYTSSLRPPSFVLRPSPSGVLARRALLGLWIVLAGLGALVSIPGALVDFQVYFHSYGLYLAGDPGEAVTLYDPANSPLLVEPGYLLNGLTAAIHRPSLASTGMPPIWDVIVPGALVVLALGCLWYGTRDTAGP
jgi:hypothetical protein